MLIVRRPRVNDLDAPLALDDDRPRLSWRTETATPQRGAAQTAWQVHVASDVRALANGDLFWDSGKSLGRDPWTLYGGAPLPAFATAAWRVRVWDEQDIPSPWSPAGVWEVGPRTEADWDGAVWVMPPVDPAVPTVDADGKPLDLPYGAPLLRGTFPVDGDVVSARLYATALGIFEARVNGAAVSDARFLPGWTDYRQRVPFHAFDLTDALVPGENVWGARLADGWFSGHLTWDRRRNTYGEHPQFRALLVLRYADGRRVVHTTGPDWRTTPGPVSDADFYDGESYDARREKDGRDAPGHVPDADWSPVAAGPGMPSARLLATPGTPIRPRQTLTPVSVRVLPDGAWCFDFGQNMVGVVRLRLRAPAGTEITLQTAEMLNPDGTLYRTALRNARSTDRYICRGACGGGRDFEEWEPAFTFHGFRYVTLAGCPGLPSMDSVTGVVLHSAMDPAGDFACSDTMLNRLRDNIDWGLRGNFLDVPTDCPQRDERLGWTGDIQVFAPTASFLYDTAAFYRKWLRDLDDSQSPEGAYPSVAPNVIPDKDGGSSWADAGIVVPWVAWQTTGDTRFITDRFDAMRRYVTYLETIDHEARHSYADWLNHDDPTDKVLLSYATSARVAGLLADMAEAVGRADEAKTLRTSRENFVARFREGFTEGDAPRADLSQTAYILAWVYDLIPASWRAAVGARLTEKVHARGDHLSTGFVGTPWLLFALDGAGETALAYTVLLKTDFPSWGYPIVWGGATTMWERWNGWHHENGFGDAGMNSFNHYAYGAVCDWMVRRLAGLDRDTTMPGGGRFVMHPLPDGRLTWARASWESPRGRVAVSWRRTGPTFHLEATVPPGSMARIVLPTEAESSIREGGRPLSGVDGVLRTEKTEGGWAIEVTSGDYAFACRAPKASCGCGKKA